MSPPSEVATSRATREAAQEAARRHVIDRWTAGTAPAVIASEARLQLEDVEAILLALLFDFR